ncbi:MAG: hypothetical protein KJ886_03945, partial [Candidatus Thermoplasmatota archaeon]|nr:hypothetical protein [Candidatus Thermoplasmatota archaeon]
MVRGVDEYLSAVVEASKSVLVELVTTLKSYSDALVLVGGWVPYFLLQKYQRKNNPFRHVGSIDIDIAVNPKVVDAEKYATIVELINERGYVNKLDRTGKPLLYRFEKKTPSPVDSNEYTVVVDFLTSESEIFSGKKHRHRTVQPDLRARMMRGCSIVFEHHTDFELKGILPKNGETIVNLRMADVVGCLGTKGIAFGERYREKDAYDIYAVIANYKKEPKDAASEVKPHLSNILINEGIKNIASRFRSINAEGPSWVANFLHPYSEDAEARKRDIADAYMNVNE